MVAAARMTGAKSQMKMLIISRLLRLGVRAVLELIPAGNGLGTTWILITGPNEGHTVHTHDLNLSMVLEVGGSWSIQRGLRQTQGEQANCTHIEPGTFTLWGVTVLTTDPPCRPQTEMLKIKTCFYLRNRPTLNTQPNAADTQTHCKHKSSGH